MAASAVLGAAVTTFLGEVSLRLVYRGDPSGPIVGTMFSSVVLGVLLLLCGLNPGGGGERASPAGDLGDQGPLDQLH